MSDPREPGDRRRRTPAGSRLERAPSERFRPAEPPPPASAEGDASPGPQTLALAVGVAVGGALLIVLLGGVLALTAGLLVVAAIIGWGVGAAVRGATGLPAPRPTAAGIAAGSVVLGQAGLWLYATTEGGALGLVDYLVQTWGWLVPAQLGVAAAAAWWTARRSTASPT